MTKHSIVALHDFDISGDGRAITLHFQDEHDFPVSIEMASLTLEKIYYDLGAAITKARQRSDLAKQVVSFLQVSRCRATLTTDDQTIVISFLAGSNRLEIHYGIEPSLAKALALQILALAKQRKTAKPVRRN